MPTGQQFDPIVSDSDFPLRPHVSAVPVHENNIQAIYLPSDDEDGSPIRPDVRPLTPDLDEDDSRIRTYLLLVDWE